MALLQVGKMIRRRDTALKVTVECVAELLATSPGDDETYAERAAANIENETGAPPTPEENVHILEEVETLPDGSTAKKGLTVFHRDENGIFLWAYQLQGFLKSAGEALRVSATEGKADDPPKKGKGTKWGSIKSKIDRFIVVRPDKLYLYRLEDGKRVPVMQPDGVCSRPLRAMTMRGERVSISRSESISPGVRLDATIDILEGAPITEMMLVEMLAYGERVGLLQWRNSGKGRFVAYIDAPEDWVPDDKSRG